MARKTLTVTIQDEGRDKGKTFILTEMPAAQVEKWATRALLALARNEVDIPSGIENAGLAGLVEIGRQALSRLSFEDIEPLMDEMFGCVRLQPDAGRPEVIRDLIPDDIEEVSTRIKLRGELWNLHTGFFIGAALLKPSTAASTADSSATQTSRPQ